MCTSSQHFLLQHLILLHFALPKGKPKDKMESTNGGIRFCAPNQAKTVYSDRISKSEWDIHRDLITDMHSLCYTKAEILDILRSEGFLPSPKQLRTRMYQWDLHAGNWGAGESGSRPLSNWTADLIVEEYQAAMEDEDDLHMNIDIDIDIPCTSDQKPFAEVPTSWASYATHSLPNCDQPTTRMTLDTQSDQASVISRQTFVTHSSDNKSMKFFRQECRRVNEISKMDRHNRSHEAAKAGLLTASGRQYMAESIGVRTHSRYQCHLCKHVSTSPKQRDAICNRCSHQRCGACLQWPKASQPSGENENDALGITPYDPMVEEDSPEGDIEAIFGIDAAKEVGH